jgi:hypothetical protein
MNLDKRMSKIEVKASPTVRKQLDELQQRREERFLKERRWRWFDHWASENHPALTVKFCEVQEAMPEMPELTDEEFEEAGGYAPMDEYMAEQVLTPDQEAIWVKYLDLYLNTPDEEIDEFNRLRLAELLKFGPTATWEEINAEWEKRGLSFGSHIY